MCLSLFHCILRWRGLKTYLFYHQLNSIVYNTTWLKKKKKPSKRKEQKLGPIRGVVAEDTEAMRLHHFKAFS